MNIRPVFYVISLLMVTLAVAMLAPAFYQLTLPQKANQGFFISALITGSVGILGYFTMKPKVFTLKPREIFLLTNSSWLILSAFAALPFFIGLKLSYTDSFFETMSGLTTTGSTILEHLATVPKDILLWRSLLQWIGGIGFIVMAVAVLPFLKVGGMRLFQSESSDWSEKFLPRSESIAKRILLVYIALSIICAYLFYIEGMNGFDAINNSMAALSTGGYSTYDDSFAHFHSNLIYWTCTIFMLLGSLPFVLYVKLLQGNPRALIGDSQVKAFFLFVIITWVGLTIWLLFNSNFSPWQALTLVAFNTTSVITTTGFALTDYTQWGVFATAVFLIITIVGGCSGSTAGGIKIFRFQIGSKLLNIQLRQLTHPRAYFYQTYNGQNITDDILRSLIAFGFFFTLLCIIVTLLLCMMGLDILTSVSATFTAIANVGPGIGNIVGPSGNFKNLPDLAKWLLSGTMLMGRLEITTVLVLLTPTFWKN